MALTPREKRNRNKHSEVVDARMARKRRDESKARTARARLAKLEKVAEALKKNIAIHADDDPPYVTYLGTRDGDLELIEALADLDKE